MTDCLHIEESGMTFCMKGDSLYPIENTALYGSLGTGVKRPEFLFVHNGRIVFVEAKQSSPHPSNRDNFLLWCEDIKEKFVHALLLFNATRLKRHGIFAYKELPQVCRKISLAKAEYVFYRVIKGHQEEWLPPINYQLQMDMRQLLMLWKIKDTSVKVINDVMAREMGFIL